MDCFTCVYSELIDCFMCVYSIQMNCFMRVYSVLMDCCTRVYSVLIDCFTRIYSVLIVSFTRIYARNWWTVSRVQLLSIDDFSSNHSSCLLLLILQRYWWTVSLVFSINGLLNVDIRYRWTDIRLIPVLMVCLKCSCGRL